MPVNAHPASQQHLDDLDLPLQLRLMRVGFRTLRLVSRAAAARVALHLFVTPRRHRAPRRETEALERATRLDLESKGRHIAAWSWQPPGGSTRGTALLVHGWEGRGGQMGSFAEPLVGLGYRVIAFDHVGHGASSGKRCSLPTMRDTLRDVAEQTLAPDESEPAAIIAHSMGSFATTLLLAEGWRGTRAVYLAPPDDLLVYFARYLELATGNEELLPDLIGLMEDRYGERAEEFEFHRLVERLHQRLLVLHSTDDRDVPIEAGRFVAHHWAGAEMTEFEGLGHRRLLRSPQVVAATVEFLAD